MSKFNIGDKVLVRNDLVLNRLYSNEDHSFADVVNSIMIEYLGKVVTIKAELNGTYSLEEVGFTWLDEMLEEYIVGIDLSAEKEQTSELEEKVMVEFDNIEVGDKLVLRSDLELFESYNGLGFVEGMEKFIGQVVTVVSIDKQDKDFQIEGDTSYYYNAEMVESFAERVGESVATTGELAVMPVEFDVIAINDESELAVGDTVLIRDDLEVGEEYGENDSMLHEGMKQYLGKISVVTHNYRDGDVDLEIDDENFWNIEMLVGKVVPKEEELDFDFEFDELPVLEEPVVEPVAVAKAPLEFKYKVGDKVRVREDLIVGNNYSHAEGTLRENVYDVVVSPMGDLRGKEATITEVDAWGNGKYSISGSEHNWTDGMLEAVAPKIVENFVINEMASFGLQVERVIFNEPATILFYTVPNYKTGTFSKPRKVIAKCKSGDTFDRETGMKVCLLSAMRKEATRELNKI